MIKLPENFKIQDDFPETSFDDWKQSIEKDFEGIPVEQRYKTKTYEGINLQFIYTKNDIENLEHIKNMPGFKNFVRGTKEEGYIDNSWLIAQELPYLMPEEFNEALIYDLNRGQDAINIILNKSTQASDKNSAIIKTGERGLVIYCKEDLEKAFTNIDLTRYPIFIKTGYSGLPFLTMFYTYLKEKGYDISKIKGAIESDPIDYAVTEGNLPYGLETTFDEMYATTKWVTKNIPQLKTIGISTLQYHNAGANIVQEIAIAISTGVKYIRQMQKRGLGINDITKSIRFTFGIGPLYFLEVAKLRAVKYLWAKIVEQFGGDEEAQKIYIHARTSFNNQTKYDPYVNMLRTTTEAFSAVVGGVDSLHTNCFDETIDLPEEFSRRIARNTQIILNEESHLNQLIDPAGGSYYVENLTGELAKKAWEYFKEIEGKGGILEALEVGYIQEEIEKIAGERQKNFAKRKNVQVGINSYANVKEEKLASKEKETLKKLNGRKEEYDKKKDKKKITEILKSINPKDKEDSVIEKAREAVKSGATIYDIANGLRKNPEQDYKIKQVITYRTAEIFEELRDASLEYKEKNGCLPKILLLPMGPLKQNKGRADFSRAFFEIAGFDVDSSKSFKTTEEAVDSALKSGLKIVVICSTDDTYPELVPQIAKGIKDANKGIIIVLAGYPKEFVEKFKQDGVDEFIYLGCDAHKILKSLMTKTGVIK